MNGPEWHIRAARPADRGLLSAFTCADPAVGWQVVLQSTATQFDATKVEVVAVATGWQGRCFRSGERASDVIMSAVMTDISVRVPPRDARVFAVVHQDNHRSLALCRRHGLVEEPSPAGTRFRL